MKIEIESVEKRGNDLNHGQYLVIGPNPPKTLKQRIKKRVFQNERNDRDHDLNPNRGPNPSHDPGVDLVVGREKRKRGRKRSHGHDQVECRLINELTQTQ